LVDFDPANIGVPIFSLDVTYVSTIK
jgi:hypothetical protein